MSDTSSNVAKNSDQLAIEKLKAKAAIAVAALSNASSDILTSASTSNGKSGLIDTIKKVQATLD